MAFQPIHYHLVSSDLTKQIPIVIEPSRVRSFFGKARDAFHMLEHATDNREIAVSLKHFSNIVLGVANAMVSLHRRNGNSKEAEIQEHNLIYLDNVINLSLNPLIYEAAGGQDLLETPEGQQRVEELFSPLNAFYSITEINSETGEQRHVQAGGFEIADTVSMVYLHCWGEPENFALSDAEHDAIQADFNDVLKIMNGLILALRGQLSHPMYTVTAEYVFNKSIVDSVPY